MAHGSIAVSSSSRQKPSKLFIHIPVRHYWEWRAFRSSTGDEEQSDRMS